MPKYKAKVYERICQQCSSSFPSERRSVKFCSQACYGLSRRRRRSVGCVACGKIFEVYFNSPTRKYCSRACCPKYTFTRGSRDHNHATVERAFSRLGASVWDLSGVGAGVPDLLVGYQGRTFLVEVKNPETSYGRRGLNNQQKSFASKWNGGPVSLAHSEAEAESLVQKWSEEK